MNFFSELVRAPAAAVQALAGALHGHHRWLGYVLRDDSSVSIFHSLCRTLMPMSQSNPIQEGYRRPLQHALQWHDVLRASIALDVKRLLNPESVSSRIPAATGIIVSDVEPEDMDVDIEHPISTSNDVDHGILSATPSPPHAALTTPPPTPTGRLQAGIIGYNMDVQVAGDEDASPVRRSERIATQPKPPATDVSTPKPKRKRRAKKKSQGGPGAVPNKLPHEHWMDAARAAGLVVDVGDTPHQRLVQRCPMCYGKPASKWGGGFKR
jgi:hypothetical protein